MRIRGLNLSNSTLLLLTDLNSSTTAAQADVWTALAYGPAGAGVAPVVINAERKIAHLDIAVSALGMQMELRILGQFEFNTGVYVVDIDVSQRCFGLQLHDAIAIFHLNCTRNLFQVDLIGMRVELDGAGERFSAHVAMAHAHVTIKPGRLHDNGERLDMETFGQVRELHVTREVANVKIQRAANIGDDAVMEHTFNSHVAGHVSGRYRATADMKGGIAFQLLHAGIACASGEISIAVSLRDAELAAVCRQRNRNRARQLEIHIELDAVVVAAGKVQQPRAALLGKLGMRRVVGAVGAFL